MFNNNNNYHNQVFNNNNNYHNQVFNNNNNYHNQVFTEDTEEVRSLPRGAVFSFLEGLNKDLSLKYVVREIILLSC